MRCRVTPNIAAIRLMLTFSPCRARACSRRQADPALASVPRTVVMRSTGLPGDDLGPGVPRMPLGEQLFGPLPGLRQLVDAPVELGDQVPQGGLSLHDTPRRP
jgi:hypothetical protein